MCGPNWTSAEAVRLALRVAGRAGLIRAGLIRAGSDREKGAAVTRGATEHLREQPLGAFGIEQLGSWADRGGELLEASRASIDALNVFPVPDGDTGTNLWLTWQAASEALIAADSSQGAAILRAPRHDKGGSQAVPADCLRLG